MMQGNRDKTSKAHQFLLEVTELQLKQKYSVNVYEAEAFDIDIFKIENAEFCCGLIGIAACWAPALIFRFKNVCGAFEFLNREILAQPYKPN